MLAMLIQANFRQPMESFAKNQDLLRSSISNINKKNIYKALLWLHGLGSYPYPTSIHLNLTLRCSARCIHCRQWTWPKHDELTSSQILKMFSIFQKWGIQTITFGGGNPLLHKDISLALKSAAQANIKIGIIAEKFDSSDSLIDSICSYVKWIRFSLDGPCPEIHDYIRNSSGLFNSVVNGIRSLRDKNKRLLIALNCVIQKRNIDYLDQMINLADNIGVDILLFKIPHGEDPKNQFLPSNNEWRRIVNFIKLSSKKETRHVKTNSNELLKLINNNVLCENDIVQGVPVKNFYKENKIHCFAPLFFLSCDSEGNIYPCDYLQADTRLWGGHYGDMRRQFNMGNIFKDDAKVLVNLGNIMEHHIHSFPVSGCYDCGCCTRFCQFNAAMTAVDSELQSQNVTKQMITKHLEKFEIKKSNSQFF